MDEAMLRRIVREELAAIESERAGAARVAWESTAAEVKQAVDRIQLSMKQTADQIQLSMSGVRLAQIVRKGEAELRRR